MFNNSTSHFYHIMHKYSHVKMVILLYLFALLFNLNEDMFISLLLYAFLSAIMKKWHAEDPQVRPGKARQPRSNAREVQEHLEGERS